MLLAQYLDRVLPSEWGVPLPWNFVFKRQYWPKLCGSKQNHQAAQMLSSEAEQSLISDDENPTHNPMIEPVADDVRRHRTVVQVRGLRKVFPAKDSSSDDFVAVDSLYLNMYKGQILSLLGHNGAGEETSQHLH